MEKQKCPELRFQQFNDTWTETSLGNLSQIRRGASPRPIEDPKWFDNDGVFGWLRIADVTQQNGRVFDIEQKLSVEGQKKTLILEEPHLILSIAATVGKPVINYVPTGIHDGFIVFLNLNADREFIFQWLERFRSNWFKLGQPGSQLNLNSELVKNQSIFLSPLMEEQTQIGNFFQNLDQSITLHEKKLTQTQNLKKAMLEKMFPKAGSTQPEIRLNGFSGDWENKSIGDVLKIKSGMSQKEIEVEKGMYPILATGGEIGRTNTPLYTKESVLIGRKGTIDKPYYMNSPFWTVDTLFYSEINETNFAYFIYVLFQKINWRNYNTSTGVPSLTSSTIHDIEIQIPEYDEQKRIAHFFKKLDETLVLQQQQLQTLKNLKQAFLEKMFV